jgi:hypothetical protein
MTTEIPPTDWLPATGHQLHRTGVQFDAVRIAGLGGDGILGPVIQDRSGKGCTYFLLPPGAAADYRWPPGVTVLGTGNQVGYVGVPALEGRTWPLSWRSGPTGEQPFVDAAALHEALCAPPAAWTWVDADPAGEPLPMLFLAHPQGAGMRELAAQLGLATSEAPVADLGALLTVRPGNGAVLALPTSPVPIALPVHASWTRLLVVRRHAALILGLDPLPRTADAPAMDRYLTDGLVAGRLMFGHAQTYGAGPCLSPVEAWSGGRKGS